MSSSASEDRAGLRRSLHLWDLVIYGIILIQPTAPMPVFGAVFNEAKGHVVTTVMIGMFAMLFTAVSYGRMARAFPSAGSAYTYVGAGLHPALGYVTGWCLLLEYVLNPVICTIWCAKAAGNIIGVIPFAVWVVFFTALFTMLNLRGIQATARTNTLLTIAMGVVIVWFLAAAARYVFGLPAVSTGDLLRPFYDKNTFTFRSLFTGTSVCILTYIGFDGISTLSEEVHNPKRNILYATVLVCFITGVFASIQVYFAQLVWPNPREAFPDVDTAFVYVAGRAGGNLLFHAMNLTLLVASIGSGMGSQLGAARVLYGMGRDEAIPKKFFGAIDPKNQIPRNNVLLIGAIVVVACFTVSYQLGAELLNFGAFFAFLGVNLAALVHYYIRGRDRSLSQLLVPVAGFLICLAIAGSLRPIVLAAGSAWVVAGILYGAYTTQGFRKTMRFAAPVE